MAERDARGHGRVEVGNGEAGAEAEYEVGLVQEVARHERAGRRAGAERERMVFRECALAGERGHHGNVGKLGELHQFGRGLGVQHALPDVDDGAIGVQHGGHQVAHVLLGRAGLVLLDGRIVQRIAGVFGVGDVAGKLQQDGAEPAVLEVGEGAAHHLRYALHHVDEARPLGDALVVGHGLEVGMHALARAGVAARDGEERHGVGVALRHAAEGVFRARAGLHREDANLVAVVDAAVAVGHVHARAFLAAENGPNALFGRLVNQRLRREGTKATPRPSALRIFTIAWLPFMCRSLGG